MSLALATFLLAVPALFSIVNPPGAAFIFNEVTAHLSPAQRRMLSDKVALYSLAVLAIAPAKPPEPCRDQCEP